MDTAIPVNHQQGICTKQRIGNTGSTEGKEGVDSETEKLYLILQQGNEYAKLGGLATG